MPRAAHFVRFGPFELDLLAAELRQNGSRTKIPEQPFQILVALIEHEGDVVTREELRQRLWSSHTFVDFEHGLNTAVKRLRETLGDSAEHPRYIETLPRHGYRLMVTVERPGLAGPPTGKSRSHRRNVWLAVVAALIVAALAGFFWRQWYRPAKVASLAVLPLDNLSGNPGEEYFADALTEALVTELGKVRELQVISRQSVMQYKRSNKPVPQIARELHVDAVVEGSVLRSDSKIRITVQLIRANPERHLWSEGYERDVSDVIALQHEVAEAIVREINASLAIQKRTKDQ